MKDLVVVQTFNTRPEAEVVKGFLEANDIFAVIVADDEGGMAPFPLQPTAKGVQVLVKKGDFQKTKRLLELR